jgi:hypothetical protein
MNTRWVRRRSRTSTHGCMYQTVLVQKHAGVSQWMCWRYGTQIPSGCVGGTVPRYPVDVLEVRYPDTQWMSSDSDANQSMGPYLTLRRAIPGLVPAIYTHGTSIANEYESLTVDPIINREKHPVQKNPIPTALVIYVPPDAPPRPVCQTMSSTVSLTMNQL